jgi:hypothetical protein
MPIFVEGHEALGQPDGDEVGIKLGDIVNYHRYQANGVVVDVDLQRRPAYLDPSEPAPNIGVDYGAGRIYDFYESEIRKVGEYDSTVPNVDPTKCGKDMGALCCRYLLQDADGSYYCARFSGSTKEGPVSEIRHDIRKPIGLYPDCQIDPIDSYGPSLRASFRNLYATKRLIAEALEDEIADIEEVRTKVSMIPEGALVTVKAAEGKSIVTHIRLPAEADRNYDDVKISGDESFTGIFEVERNVTNPDSTPTYEIRNERGYLWLDNTEPLSGGDLNFIVTDVRQPE